MKLRITLCVTALMMSATAFAHPNDNDSVAQLPVGTKFTSLREVNVKPNTSSFYIQNGNTITYAKYVVDTEPLCELRYAPSPSDRVLKVGASLEYSSLWYEGYPSGSFTSIDKLLEERTVWFLDFKESERLLICYTAKNSTNRSLTIGELKEILRDVIEVGPFPPPTDF